MATEARRSLLDRRRALVAHAGGRADARTTPSSESLGEVAEIDAALARIEDGCYGLCEACGQAIGRQRLGAVPEARLCQPCADRA